MVGWGTGRGGLLGVEEGGKGEKGRVGGTGCHSHWELGSSKGAAGKVRPADKHQSRCLLC